MKKRTFLLSLVIMLFTVLPVVAYAANQTEMNTLLTLTIDEPPPPTQQSATYEINIPATLSLNSGNTLYITSNSMNLNTGQNVIVYADAKSFTVNDYITFSGSSMWEISVSLYRQNSMSQSERIRRGDIVARFDNSGTSPIEYGKIYFEPFHADVYSAPPGTYTGVLHFKIELVN